MRAAASSELAASSKIRRTDTSGGNSTSCGTYPSFASLRAATDPASGASNPARIRSSVDLPEPFGPMSPSLSPSDTESEISSNRGLAPKDFVNDWQLNSNDMGHLL